MVGMHEREGKEEKAKEWVVSALMKLRGAISELKREDAWEKERESRDEDRLIELMETIELMEIYCTLLKHTERLIMKTMKFMKESKRW